MSYSHCILSILSDFVCFFCNSISFLRQYFPFFVLSVVPSLSTVISLHSSFRSLFFSFVLSLSYVTAVYLSFAVVSPLYFVNSLRPCFLFSRFYSLFAFSVVICLSYVSPFLY